MAKHLLGHRQSTSLPQTGSPSQLVEIFISFFVDKILIKKPTLDLDILKSYRPESNLRFNSKVLEVVDTRIERNWVDNDLHEELQSAYCRSH